MQQMGQSIYTFPQLYTACRNKGLRATLHQFDCGQTIEVYSHHMLLTRITAECSDAFTAADRMAQWLMANRHLSVLDLADTQHASINPA